MSCILIVDDEKNIRESLDGVLSDEGYDVLHAESGEDAMVKLKDPSIDLVLLDIWMTGMDGIETLKKIKSDYEFLPVIMISGHGNIETAVNATKLGAYDFIEKPLSIERVIITVGHALKAKKLEAENIVLKSGSIAKSYDILGESKGIASLKSVILKVAPTNSWVLITGENGTGKELVARNIFKYSKRSSEPFVEVNCAAIPEELIESELFGHEKGAFTGAVSQKKGKFDIADGGTIFLDEIGDMTLKAQAKVLRILQEQNFERVGGNKQIKVDVRVICATNKDLLEEIAKGNFREDLYYRLNVIPFHIPPLRDRSDDVELFINTFLEDFSNETARDGVLKISPEAVSCLKLYKWPGNVRELKNLAERLVILTDGTEISVDDLPPYLISDDFDITEDFSDNLGDYYNIANLKNAKKAFEKEYIIKKLSDFDGNIAKTAKNIGLERSHLYRKIKAYNIKS